MAFDTSWVKTTALSAAQHASAVLLTTFGGDAVDVWSIEWHKAIGLAAGTALVSVLAAVVAYAAPSAKKAALLSVPTGAVQAANTAVAELPTYVHDVDGARGA